MREIKFRAWDIVEGYMMTVDSVQFPVGGIIVCGPGVGYGWSKVVGTHNKETMVLEQFIGLHDKNGKEIYENDIVKADGHNPSNYQIEFIEGGFCGTWNGGEGYPLDINHFYGSAGCSIRVIGNIHESPELL
jgi:uncharacterized phage protein (TIGR01671 family)